MYSGWQGTLCQQEAWEPTHKPFVHNTGAISTGSQDPAFQGLSPSPVAPPPAPLT